MNSEYGSEQRNNALSNLKQRAQTLPTMTDQQPNVLYTMPMQTVERLEEVLRRTLALQEQIRTSMETLATEESLEPMATSEELLDWVDQVQRLNQETYQSMGAVLNGMKEENRQAGKKRDEFTGKLSDMEENFRRNWDGRMRELERSGLKIILSSAGISMLVCVLLWMLLR